MTGDDHNHDGMLGRGGTMMKTKKKGLRDINDVSGVVG